MVVLSPIWPLVLRPQPHSVPFCFKASVREPLAAMLRQSVSVPICTGVVLAVVVPSPSWPFVFVPQAQRVPSSFKATV